MNISRYCNILLWSSFRDMDEYFKISLHDPRTIANLRNNYIKIDPGHEYTILITPVGTIADESVKSISPAARKCLFWSEFNSTNIFSYYSETGNAYEKTHFT